MPTQLITPQIRTAGAAALVFTSLVAAVGCGQDAPHGSGPTPAPASRRHLYVGLDTSSSWRPYLAVSATLCARQALRLDPDQGDRLSLYRMDSSTREFSDGPAPESTDRLQRTIVAEVGAASTTRGTFPARFWKAVAARAGSEAGRIVVEAFGDADNDDQTARSRSDICRAARTLAANPHVASVCIFGADPRNWSTLRAEFRPLGERFHLCSPPEMTMDRVTAALDASP